MAEGEKGLVGEFKAFVLRGNVVDLAVAVVIGTAFTAVVKAFVSDLLTPVIAILGPRTNFGQLAFHVRGGTFAYGDFLNTVITFVITAAAVFFGVVAPVNYMLARRKRAMAGGEAPAPATLTDEAVLLGEIRDILQGRRQTG